MPELSPETKALREALDAAQRDREFERSRAIAAESQLRTETGNRFAAQEAQVRTEISTIDQQSQILQDQVENLMAEGNFKEAAAANRQLAANEAKLLHLKGQQEWIEGQKTASVAQASDPLASYNSAERAWIEKNPHFLSDPAFAERVKAAAGYAMRVKGHAKDSPEYYAAIEADLYPERNTRRDPDPAASAGDDPADDGQDGANQDNSDMNLPSAPPVSDIPLDIRPEQPQARAVGRGGDGIRSVAAPPSRRIAETSRALAQRTGGRIEPTFEELQVARRLYADIEPELARTDGSDEAAVRWYHMMYHHPSHKNTRRRDWVGAL